MKRRNFLLLGLATSGAVVLGWGLMPARNRLGKPQAALGASVDLNAWIKIDAQGRVVLAMPRSEMGQGVFTGLATLVAEELNMPASAVVLEQAGSDSLYGNVAMLVGGLPFHPKDGEAGHETGTVKTARWIVGKVARELGMHATGGSSSMSDAWLVLRQAAALARTALVKAGAKQLGVEVSACQLANGIITHSASNKSVGIGEVRLAALEMASSLSPSDAAVKPREQWTLIGKDAPRVDSAKKSNGTAVFGQDIKLDNCVYAVVQMCPQLGGSIASLNEDLLFKQTGVSAVVELSSYAGSTEGFAVVANNTYLARRAAEHIDAVVWKDGPNAQLNSANEIEKLRKTVEGSEKGTAFYSLGDVPAALKNTANGSKTIEAWYQAPYLAHATLEPMNCIAQVQRESDGSITRVDVWAPTQVPEFARQVAAQAAACKIEKVHVHVTLLGGGFGRRLETDFIAQGVRVALVTKGKPVKLLWPREQDMRHDFYRPAQVARCKAVIANGKIEALDIRCASDSISPYFMGRHLPMLAADTPDKTSAEGLFDQSYDIPHQHIEHVRVKSKVPIGFWRSVGHSYNAFMMESFIDELAHAQNQDPADFRLALLKTSPRHRKVLELAMSKADYGKPSPAGRVRGVAVHESFGTIVAQIAEVSLNADKSPQVHRVVVALDCGVVINPVVVRQQVESSVVFGLTAALYGQIDIKNGKVQQGNFNDYPMLRMQQAPLVETFWVESDRAPSGIGEPATPPIAAALGNALFKLSGQRLRQLPFALA